MALALVRNYDSFKSPTHFKLTDLLKKFDKTFGGTKSAEKGKYGSVEGDRTRDDIEKRRADRWNFLFIAGMWFQDLFNYDFRRTEMCIIPYATQQGEISFCAYNTGIGWRNIIEKMHMTATLTKWYEEHGRHEIFAGGKAVPLDSTEHSLKLNEEAVRAGAQTDLDELGIAKNAREEKLQARKHRTPRSAEVTTPRWPSSTRSTCSRSSRRCRFRDSAAEEEAGRAAGAAQADRSNAGLGLQASGSSNDTRGPAAKAAGPFSFPAPSPPALPACPACPDQNAAIAMDKTFMFVGALMGGVGVGIVGAFGAHGCGDGCRRKCSAVVRNRRALSHVSRARDSRDSGADAVAMDRERVIVLISPASGAFVHRQHLGLTGVRAASYALDARPASTPTLGASDARSADIASRRIRSVLLAFAGPDSQCPDSECLNS